MARTGVLKKISSQIKTVAVRLFALSNLIALIALYFAYRSYEISKESLKTSLGVKEFVSETERLIHKEDTAIEKQDSIISINMKSLRKSDSLLTKTDLIITNGASQSKYSNSLLIINAINVKSAELQNKYKFVAAIIELAKHINTLDSVKQWDDLTDKDPNVGERNKYVAVLLSIFQGQMNNPYLHEHQDMFQKWVNAYVHLCIVGHQGTMDDTFDNTFDIRDRTRFDDIIQKKYCRAFICAWAACDSAYNYCGNKTRPEIIKYLNDDFSQRYFR
jgi:hypothetical protein